LLKQSTQGSILKINEPLKDRRLRERFALEIPVQIATSSSTDSDSSACITKSALLSCVTKDISERGVHLATDVSLELGTRVELLFDISGQKRTTFPESSIDTTIHAKGKVTRKTEGGLAVHFDEVFRIVGATLH
jgi:hypothetical protein